MGDRRYKLISADCCIASTSAHITNPNPSVLLVWSTLREGFTSAPIDAAALNNACKATPASLRAANEGAYQALTTQTQRNATGKKRWLLVLRKPSLMVPLDGKAGVFVSLRSRRLWPVMMD
ncbi:hypothetical protein HL42_0837 [Trichophyton rubrum]|nr:hypothetical protein HL42_0837 [Trichophyton rubrum]